MSVLSYKDYKAVIEFDPDDELFTGHIVGINDVVGFHATTVKALKTAFHEAVDDYLATCRKVGKQPERQMSGNLMLRVDPQVHANAAIAAELSGKSLNQWAEEILRREAASKMRSRSKSARAATKDHSPLHLSSQGRLLSGQAQK